MRRVGDGFDFEEWLSFNLVCGLFLVFFFDNIY